HRDLLPIRMPATQPSITFLCPSPQALAVPGYPLTLRVEAHALAGIDHVEFEIDESPTPLPAHEESPGVYTAALQLPDAGDTAQWTGRSLVEVGNRIYVECGGVVESTGRGFLGGYRGDNTAAEGRTTGNAAGPAQAGGSHAGRGGGRDGSAAFHGAPSYANL